MPDYEAVIGLEIHAQLLTRTKMFCACPAVYGAAPNTNVCPVCLGLPGALPVVNARAVELAVKTGLALKSTIAGRSVFARKNYFYPDSPKNYQITQYERPLCTGGGVSSGAGKNPVRIKRIHLEEDAGKLLHPEGGGASYVDMNRAGVPLVEIVTEPDMDSPEAASAFVRALRAVLQYIEVCDGNMDEGSLRCDANVSLREAGSGRLGAATEIKNLNSFRFIEHALESEIERQRRVLVGGGSVGRATLLWDDATGRCVVMRAKEAEPDYRYFPEPDLPPLDVPEAFVEGLRGGIPELPGARAERFVSDHGIPPHEANVLTGSRALADYFEAAAAETGDPGAASRWVVGEVLRELNEKGIAITELRISPRQLASLISRVSSGRINLPTAKRVFKHMAETEEDPDAIIVREGLGRIADEGALVEAVARVLDRQPAEVTAFVEGKDKLFTFFVGEVMKETGGRADTALVRRLLVRALDGRRRR